MFNPVSGSLLWIFFYPGSGSWIQGPKNHYIHYPNPDPQHCVLQLMTKSKLVHQPSLIYYKELQWYDKQSHNFYTFFTKKSEKIHLLSKNSKVRKTPRLYS
jgi:hypothetical protein